GFFLHIPLPPAALLTMLPHHEHLFPELGSYDLIGLQNARDRDALLEYFRAEMQAKTRANGDVQLRDGRRLRVLPFPVAIDTLEVARQARRAVASAATQRLVKSLEHR